MQKLATLANITFGSGDAHFIGQLTHASIATRYPDDLNRMVSQYPSDVTRSYLEKARKTIQWLKDDPRLRL
ncbi:MAG: hypothetical protein IT210_14240 [Armatimonadetes bacterium]|nr:hypothetical protein [Armatimonadota bacterium]